MATTGVYPCYTNQFKINTTPTSEATMSTIADCETFEVSFDNGVEEWTPFDTEGWTRRLLTAKAVTISVTAKRNVGDAGNDFIAKLDKTTVKFEGAVINVTNIGAGDSTAVAPLEFEIMSNGKPTVTPSM